MNITITKTTHPGTLPPSDQLGFGTVFTDHMFLMDYSADKGWHDARVVPYGPITMSPAASVLHYGTEVFEGMKAYRRPDGGVQLFRPWENVARLNRSCERLGLPQLDPDDALQAIKTVVKVDENWVPSDPGTSLYIRPFLYGTDPTLALHGVHEATFAVILSPSGSYFKNGLQPVPIMVETEDVRAVRGGTGEAKCGGNYGAANRAGDRAIEKGFSQVLWLDGVERKYGRQPLHGGRVPRRGRAGESDQRRRFRAGGCVSRAAKRQGPAVRRGGGDREENGVPHHAYGSARRAGGEPQARYAVWHCRSFPCAHARRRRQRGPHSGGNGA